MTPSILDPETYVARIRSRLGVTESHLSQEEIDEVLPEIEEDYKEWVTDWESKTGTDKIRLQSSVVCMTASRLCAVVKGKFAVREQGPGGSFETPVDWDAKAKELEQEANRLLFKLIDPPSYVPFRVV